MTTTSNYKVCPLLAPALTEIHVEQLCKWPQGNEVWALAIVDSTHLADQDAPLPPPLQALVDDVFQEPKTLLPHRVFDHAILLEPRLRHPTHSRTAIHHSRTTRSSVSRLLLRCSSSRRTIPGGSASTTAASTHYREEKVSDADRQRAP